MTPDAWTYCRLNLGTELLSPPFVWVCVETIYRGGFIFDITAVAMTKLFFCLGNASIEELLALFVRPMLLLVIKQEAIIVLRHVGIFFFFLNSSVSLSKSKHLSNVCKFHTINFRVVVL